MSSLLLSLFLFIVMIADQFTDFAYSPRLAGKTIIITKHLISKQVIKISDIERLVLELENIRAPFSSIQAVTAHGYVSLKQIKVFSHKKNIEFVQQILEQNPSIQLSTKLKKYLNPDDNTFMIDEHLPGYVSLLGTGMFFVAMLVRYILY